MACRKTVREGRQLQTIDRYGRTEVHNGPTRVSVFRKTYQFLERYNASQKEYLEICYRNGRVEHRPGPCFMYHDPYQITSIQVKEAVSLDANEVLVVYSKLEKEGPEGQVTTSVVRRIQYGPTLYVPDANEWLHSFVWHGTDRKNKTRKIPGGLTFNKLRVIPDQFYFNVQDVRTKDDALLTVKLMIFFELTDIEVMLNSTTDPIGDFINATTADVIAFAATLSYEDFMENTSLLNVLDNYKQLIDRSKHIGYQVTKVVFRGYHASGTLQDLHDKAVQRRTQMKVKLETETKEQDFTDFKLRNDHQREALEQNMKLEETVHQYQLEKEQIVHELKLDEKQKEEALKRRKETALAELRAKEKEMDEKLALLSSLNNLSVNITDYLTSENPRPDNLLRIVTTGQSAAVHIHPST